MGKAIRDIKIICTLGPASFSKEVLKRMILAGMDIARLNFSYGDYNFFHRLIRNIREASIETKKRIEILQDLQGPRIRIGKLYQEKIFLEEGDTIILFSEDKSRGKKIPIVYKSLARNLKKGDIILIDNGMIELSVLRIKNKDIYCRVNKGGVLRSSKGVNLPNIKVNLPSLTPKDLKDIKFALNEGVDKIAISFVRIQRDVKELRNILTKANKKDIKIVSKIETYRAFKNFDSILKISDEIMIARGDLGIEVKAAEVPFIQKILIKKCNLAEKPVITATQILSSMTYNNQPTRAEVNDMINNILDGTNALMLSEETSIGRYPVEAVKTMRETIDYADRVIKKYLRMGL